MDDQFLSDIKNQADSKKRLILTKKSDKSTSVTYNHLYSTDDLVNYSHIKLKEELNHGESKVIKDEDTLPTNNNLSTKFSGDIHKVLPSSNPPDNDTFNHIQNKIDDQKLLGRKRGNTHLKLNKNNFIKFSSSKNKENNSIKCKNIIKPYFISHSANNIYLNENVNVLDDRSIIIINKKYINTENLKTNKRNSSSFKLHFNNKSKLIQENKRRTGIWSKSEHLFFLRKLKEHNFNLEKVSYKLYLPF